MSEVGLDFGPDEPKAPIAPLPLDCLLGAWAFGKWEGSEPAGGDGLRLDEGVEPEASAVPVVLLGGCDSEPDVSGASLEVVVVDESGSWRGSSSEVSDAAELDDPGFFCVSNEPGVFDAFEEVGLVEYVSPAIIFWRCWAMASSKSAWLTLLLLSSASISSLDVKY